MSVVEEIYRSNSQRRKLESDERTRPVISLRESISRKAEKGKLGLIAEFKKRSPSGFSADQLSSPIKYFSRIEREKVAGFSILT